MDINYYKQYEPIFGAWHITRLIGEGAFGKVFEMEREDFGVTCKAALKAITIPASQSEVRSVMDDGTDAAEAHGYLEGCVRELVEKIALVYKLRGSNVVSYEDHQVIEHKDGVGWDILIQMELLTPLNSYIQEKKAMPRQEIIKLGIDLCKALELCQKYNIIHRDIKPENIFISEHGDFKLGNFDIAQVLDRASDLAARGTYSYMAPEVYKGEAYGFTADIYSLGLVLYRLLNGNRLPFLPAEPVSITYADRENALTKRFSGVRLTSPAHAEGRLSEIVLKACAYDPRDRYADPAQMRQALEQVDDCSPAPPEAVPSGHAWPREWRTREICSFALCQGGTEFTCDGDQVTMKLNLKREDGQPFAPRVVRLTSAQRDSLWKQLERISREGWAMTNEQAALLGAFDYEWSKCFQCELTGGRQFQYCSNGDVPPGFTALYEFLQNLAFPHGRCPEDAHAFVPAIMRGGWNCRPEEYLYCEKCGLTIPLLGAELYPGSKLQGVAYAWPAAWRAEDILRFSVSFGDRPIRHFTYDGGILTAVNRIDVSRDGGASFPRGYFDPVSIALPDRQKARLRGCLAAIPRERWSSDTIALQYDLQCPTGYTRHSFFSCELKDGGKFDYLPGKEAAPGFVRLCRCLEDILPWKEAESEPGFGSGCSGERSECLKRGYDDMTINYDPKNMTKEQLQAVADRMYPGIALFARDVNLPAELARKYVPGQIIREKAFTDASIRFMGMVTTHRYVILSNHMANLAQFEHGTNWGLHMANKDSHFKVLGLHTHEGKTGIFLLHLPDDESWRLWQTAEFSMDRQLYDMAVQRFVNKCTQPPVPELTTTAWLDRCTFPLGMSGDGQFWLLEDAPEEKAAVLSEKAERPAPPPVSSDPREVKRSRYLGCLLGGAVGDALGFPIEFMKENAIWEKYGPKGIQTLAQAGHPALISDDTQMTLFAANAIVYTKRQGGSLDKNLWAAYREWLGTQGEKERMDDPEHPKMWVYREPRMHALRAPGNSCMNAIRHSPHGGTPKEPINNSKGCGTVMRAAPFGLSVHHDPDHSYGDEFIGAHKAAWMDAALTHGHELAWASSSMLAQIIHYIVQQYPKRDYRLELVIPHVGFPGDKTAHQLLDRAMKLALDASVSDLDGIHALGEGWVAEEALAIAVFCAVRYQDDFAAAIRAAVNHKGDSDSTGAICGNILGAWLGKEAVEAAFDLENLELRDVIEKMANQLFEAVEVPAEEKPEVHAPKTPPAAPEPPKAEPLKPLRPVGMLYTPLTKHAMAICFDTHKNQFDKSGLPYVFHPFHLAEQMETEYEVCAALLHDVIEDSHHTPGELSQAGFPDEVVRAVRALTRDPHMHYLDYVARLRQNPIARRVKLADLAHNSDLNRLDSVTSQDRRRVLKYRMARAILEDDRYDKVLEHFRKVLPLSLDDPLFLSVFYDRQGVVQEYSIDIEKAEDSHYEFDARQGEKLRLALDPSRTLPEALADWAEKGCSCFRVESMLRKSGIAFQPFHYD